MRKYLNIYEEAVSHICLCTQSLLISFYMSKFCFLFYQYALFPFWKDPNQTSWPWSQADRQAGSIRLPSRCRRSSCTPARGSCWNCTGGTLSLQQLITIAYREPCLTVPKIRFIYSQKWNCKASFQFLHSCICKRFTYSQAIGRPTLGIYKSLTDTWM